MRILQFPRPQADPAKVASLERLLASLDPFALSQTIEKKLDGIYHRASRTHPSPTPRSTVSSAFHSLPQKEKSSKKERKEGLWKLTLLMEIRKERGYPQQLEKSLAKDARLFHSSHRPNNKDLSTMYCRQRSTLRRLNFGPKNGEPLNDVVRKFRHLVVMGKA